MPARRNKAEGSTTPVTQVVEVVEEEETPVTEPPDATTKSMVEELYTPETSTRVMPEISMHKNSPKKSLMVWAIVTILVALVTGGVLFAVSKKDAMPSIFAGATPTPTQGAEPTATPTPKPVDKTSFEIKVLNGGGTPGAASKMKKALEDLGYTVSATGNTEEYTYETTEIHGKATMADAVASLKVDLKEAYTLGTVDTLLDASSSADVEVIVGKE